MKTFNKCIVSILLIIHLSGCHSLVEDTFLELPVTPVINGVLQPDSIIRIHLSFTSNLNDSIPPAIQNAKVNIQSTEGWNETLAYTGDGWFSSARTSKENEAYKCVAEIQGFPLLSASTSVPAVTEVGDIIYTPTVSKDEDGMDISSIRFSIINRPGKQLFWEVRMLKEGLVFDWDSKSELVKIREVSIYMLAGNDRVLQHEALPLTVFSNKKITENHYDVVFYIPGWSIGHFTNGKLVINESDNFYIELRNADESYYHYQKQAYLYITSGGAGFATATQSYPLYSNVENGLGIFTSFSSVRRKIELNK